MKRITSIGGCLVILAMTVACGGDSAPPAAEAPTLDVTSWTGKTELFMEYPPLVAGKTALFAVHLTHMHDFKPVTAGQAKVEFTPEGGGQPTALTGPRPSRPGAFGWKAPRPPRDGIAGRSCSTRRNSRTGTISD